MVKLESKYEYFLLWKCILVCCMQNIGYFLGLRKLISDFRLKFSLQCPKHEARRNKSRFVNVWLLVWYQWSVQCSLRYLLSLSFTLDYIKDTMLYSDLTEVQMLCHKLLIITLMICCIKRPSPCPHNVWPRGHSPSRAWMMTWGQVMTASNWGESPSRLSVVIIS